MTERQKAVWRTAAFVIASGSLIAMLNFGLRGSYGLFQRPMMETLGWTSATFSWAIAIQNLLWGLGQPFAGAIADKYGTARVIIGGTLVYALGLYLTSLSTTPFEFIISAGILVGLGASTTGLGIILSAVGRAVSETQRSFAMGIATAGNSFGQFAMLLIGQSMINGYGWETTAVLFAVMSLAMIPLAIPFSGAGNDDDAVDIAGQPGRTLLQTLDARQHRSYVLLTSGFFVCGFHVAFIVAHMPAYLQDRGLSATWGATAVATIGIANLFGAFISGWLGGIYPKRLLLAWIYIARSVAIFALITLPATPFNVIAISIAIGLLWLSTVPLTSGLVAVMFGTRYMATLVGIVTLGHQVGAFFGVLLGGYLRDATGSYDLLWWMGIVLGIFAALIHLPIREQRMALPAAV